MTASGDIVRHLRVEVAEALQECVRARHAYKATPSRVAVRRRDRTEAFWLGLTRALQIAEVLHERECIRLSTPQTALNVGNQSADKDCGHGLAMGIDDTPVEDHRKVWRCLECGASPVAQGMPTAEQIRSAGHCDRCGSMCATCLHDDRAEGSEPYGVSPSKATEGPTGQATTGKSGPSARCVACESHPMSWCEDCWRSLETKARAVGQCVYCWLNGLVCSHLPEHANEIHSGAATAPAAQDNGSSAP